MSKIEPKYKMLFTTMFCYLFFYTGRHNFGWASKPMSEELNLSYTFIGWISFAMLIGYSIGQLINGSLADRLNPRYMVPVGAYLSIACNIGISFLNSGELIMILWFLNGLFQSMAWAPGGKIITQWFSGSERNKAFGLYTMAAGSSSAITFLISILLTSFDLEWRMLFRLPVIFLFISATFFLIFIKPKPDNSEIRIEVNKNKKEAIKGIFTSYKKVFSNTKFIRVCLSFGLESMARYGLIFWIPVHFLGSSWKYDPTYIWVTLFLPIGMALGAFSFGQMATSLFKNNYASIVFGMLICTVLSLCIYFYEKPNFFVLSCLLVACGFFVYGPQSNFWALCPEIIGVQSTGTAIGVMNMFGYLCAALIEPVLGAVIDFAQTTKVLFIIISGICFLSAINIMALRGSK